MSTLDQSRSTNHSSNGLPPLTNSHEQLFTAPNRKLKWYATMDQIFNDSGQRISQAVRERFYMDLFCLRVDKVELTNRIKVMSIEQLNDIYRVNLNDLLGYGIKCLKNCSEKKIRGGSMSAMGSTSQHTNEDDEIDDIDQIRLPNVIETLSIVIRQILVKEGFQNFGVDVINLIAGSLEHSDQVFSDLVAGIDHILSDSTQDLLIRHKTLQMALSIVAAINQGSINAYFLRRDLFSTIAALIADPLTVSLTFDSVLLLGLLANFRRFESRNPYLVRIEDYVDEIAMERIISLSVLALQDLKLAYMAIKDESSTSLIGQVAASVFSVFTSPRKRSASNPRISNNHAFDSQPARPVCILLPIYDLLSLNTTFSNVLISNDHFWEVFLSFSSYLFSHASANSRSSVYSRLVFTILTVLVEENGTAICGQDGRMIKVEVCRQRQPPLGPASDEPRPLISAILDCTVLYLRHNLQRKLKIDCHMICLKLVHQLLYTLQNNHCRLSSGFEWQELWRALITLGSRVGGRIDELKEFENIDRLAQQILDILSFAAIWSETIFIDRKTTSILFFEILRAEHTIKKLEIVAGISPEIKNSTAGASTIESSKNLKTIICKIKQINDNDSKNNGGEIKKDGFIGKFNSAEDVLESIERKIDEIVLIDSASLENHLRKSNEVEKNKDLKNFISVVTEDVFQLMV